MAKFIKADGTTQNVKPAHGETFTLKELQTYVGGYIEFIYLGEQVLVIDEEGKFKNKPQNETATTLGRMAGIADDDYIVGDALFVAPNELEQ